MRATPATAREAVRARGRELFDAMRSKDPTKVFALAQQTIAEFYLDLDAHKARYQSCQILKRPDCAKYKAVSLGLLRSIVHGRDGKTCATGWEVVRVAEEYFVADVLDLSVRGQRLVHDAHVCDALDVEDEQKLPRTIYFDIDAMLAATELAASGSGQ